MGTLSIFRGKAATGKTLLTTLLSKKTGICVLRKDDFFDPLSRFLANAGENNGACHELLAQIVNENLRAGVDLILDIALARNVHYETFIEKLKLEGIVVHRFLCDCSDEEKWLSRFAARFENPTPNQAFTSVEQVKQYYEQAGTILTEGEILLDSVNPPEKLLQTVLTITGFAPKETT